MLRTFLYPEHIVNSLTPSQLIDAYLYYRIDDNTAGMDLLAKIGGTVFWDLVDERQEIFDKVNG